MLSLSSSPTRVLFIVKQRSYGCDWGETYSCAKQSSGLSNSAGFVQQMLSRHVETKMVAVVDNNCIDREVTQFRPDVVIIEAFWVVPSKFHVLTKLHPRVKWVIRNHSNWPFASNEGNLLAWAIDYLQYPNVFVSCNRQQTNDSFRQLLATIYREKTPQQIEAITPYLPNYYPIDQQREIAGMVQRGHGKRDEIHIGNFGAIRPLKNSLIQAIAAVVFATKIDKKLVYHINGGRIEGNGDPILKSIVALFDRSATGAKLVRVPWLAHEQFVQYCRQLDIVMQTSFDETFNIVAADAVAADVPIVVSDQVPWANRWLSVVDNINDVQPIVDKLVRAHRWGGLIDTLFDVNRKRLRCYSDAAKNAWLAAIDQLVK